MEREIAVFKGRKIRRTWHNNEWHFSIIDIVAALTDSPAPRQYWGVLKRREPQLLTICLQLKLPSADGKRYSTDCVTTENAFRLIQSIPSKKAEPFKRWLARVGYERLREIENPDEAYKRLRRLYRAKGHSDAWISKRIAGIDTRKELTDEWNKTDPDYSTLTNEIYEAAFGKSLSELKDHKQIRDNLRDHMTDLELILTMLAEQIAKEVTQKEGPKSAARKGGRIAASARRELDKQPNHTSAR